MIRSVLALRPAAGRSAELEKFYADQQILERAKRFPGCLDAVLLRPIPGAGTDYLVIADWESPDDYQQWVNDPWRSAQSLHLAALLDTGPDVPVIGALYEPVPDR